MREKLSNKKDYPACAATVEQMEKLLSIFCDIPLIRELILMFSGISPRCSVLKGHQRWVRWICMSKDNRSVISCSDDASVRIWNYETGELVRTIQGGPYSGAVWATCVSNEQLIFCSSSNKVTICELETGRLIHKLEGHTDNVYGCCVSPNGDLIVSGGWDNSIKVWDRATGKYIRGFEAFCGVWKCYLTMDSLYVVAIGGSSNENIFVFDFETGKKARILQGHTQGVSSCNISNRYLLSGSEDKTARIWDIETWEEVRVLNGHRGTVGACAISSDERFVVTGSDDQTLKIWNLESGHCMKTLKGHTGYIRAVCISRDNQFIISGASDSHVRIWDVEIGKPVSEM